MSIKIPVEFSGEDRLSAIIKELNSLITQQEGALRAAQNEMRAKAEAATTATERARAYSRELSYMRQELNLNERQFRVVTEAIKNQHEALFIGAEIVGKFGRAIGSLQGAFTMWNTMQMRVQKASEDVARAQEHLMTVQQRLAEVMNYDIMQSERVVAAREKLEKVNMRIKDIEEKLASTREALAEKVATTIARYEEKIKSARERLESANERVKNAEERLADARVKAAERVREAVERAEEKIKRLREEAAEAADRLARLEISRERTLMRIEDIQRAIAELQAKSGIEEEERQRRLRELLLDLQDAQLDLKDIEEDIAALRERQQNLPQEIAKAEEEKAKAIEEAEKEGQKIITDAEKEYQRAIAERDKLAAEIVRLEQEKNNEILTITADYNAQMQELQNKLIEAQQQRIEAEKKLQETITAEQQRQQGEILNLNTQLIDAQNKLTEALRNQQNAWIETGLQAGVFATNIVGLIPQFMSLGAQVSAFGTVFGGLSGILGTVKGAFMGLYAAMGPIGLILIALSVIIPIIITHWEQIRGALEAVGQAVWGVVGPALQWLWDTILKPLVDFIIGYFINAWKGAKVVLEAGEAAAKAVGDAFGWLWNTIIKPFIEWLMDYSVNELRKWIGVFEWIRDKMEAIWDAIVGAIKGAVDWILDKLNAVKDAIFGAFDWLHKQLVGGSIVPEMMSDIVAWTKWGIGEVDKMMSDFGVNVMGPKVVGGINVVINVTGTNASADEIAQAVSRAILRNLRGMGT